MSAFGFFATLTLIFGFICVMVVQAIFKNIVMKTRATGQKKTRNQSTYNARLLSGIEALKHPFWFELNKSAGRNDRLLHAVLCAYVKHHCDHMDLGWNEVDDILFNAICNEVGDDAYCRWIAMIPDDQIEPARRSPRVTSKHGIKRKKKNS